MANDNMYKVNIYYSEEEVHAAFKNYYNEVKQESEVHIFTKNVIPLSLYGEEDNVLLHSTGSLWDKFKAWLAGEPPFQQEFSQLNISKEKSERYRSIINKGGTIIVSTHDDYLTNESNSAEQNDGSFEEIDATPLPSSTTNDLDLHQTADEDLQSNSHKENQYLADVSTSEQIPVTNDPLYEDYEDGPRKHNLYSENLKKLTSEQEETFDQPKHHDVVPDESNGQPEDFTSHIKNSDQNQETTQASMEQLQDLVQQAQKFLQYDNNQAQPNELLNIVQQLSPEEAMNIFNLISSNVPTDSTESVLDFDLLSKIGKDEMTEVSKLFSVEEALQNVQEIIEQPDLSLEDEPILSTEPLEADPLLNEVSPETTTEHTRHDSP